METDQYEHAKNHWQLETLSYPTVISHGESCSGQQPQNGPLLWLN